MAMSIDQARARLGVIKEDANRMRDMGNHLMGLINQVQAGLNQISGSGINPERMPSTLALCNELKRLQEEQRARMFTLISEGIDKL